MSHFINGAMFGLAIIAAILAGRLLADPPQSSQLAPLTAESGPLTPYEVNYKPMPRLQAYIVGADQAFWNAIIDKLPAKGWTIGPPRSCGLMKVENYHVLKSQVEMDGQHSPARYPFVVVVSGTKAIHVINHDEISTPLELSYKLRKFAFEREAVFYE